MKGNIKMEKKHHCKRESENIQYNKLKISKAFRVTRKGYSVILI
jgi:hypothetical protein